MPAWCRVSTRYRKSSGRAEPRGRRVVRGDLVPPRAAERVLGHRQELDVGEPEVGHVGGQLDRELPVGQAGPPRAEVHLVDRHRAGQRRPDGALGQPVAVVPLVRGLVHDRGGGGRRLGVGRHRVGLVPPHPVGPADGVLVGGAGGDAGHEQLPHPGPAERAHRVRPPVPEVEVADEPDPARVRRPDRERGAGLRRPRAERAPELLVPALADQVQVDLAERGKVPVGVVLQLGLAVHVPNFKFVISNGPGRLWHRHLEDTLVAVRHRVAAAVGQHDGHLGGSGRRARMVAPSGPGGRRERSAGHGAGRRRPFDLAERDHFVLDSTLELCQ